MNWTWIITIAGIIGTIANVRKKRWCFYIWTGTNLSWMLVNLYIKLYSAVFMFFIYLILSICGLVSWRKNGE